MIAHVHEVTMEGVGLRSLAFHGHGGRVPPLRKGDA